MQKLVAQEGRPCQPTGTSAIQDVGWSWEIIHQAMEGREMGRTGRGRVATGEGGALGRRGGKFGSSHVHCIQSTFPGLIHGHKATQTCARNLAGARLSHPIVAAGAYPVEQMTPYLKEPANMWTTQKMQCGLRQLCCIAVEEAV